MDQSTRLALILWIMACVLSASPARASAAGELSRQIDQQIDARLEREGIEPAEQADDAEFLRRVYLDLHGVVPTFEQSAAFLVDTDPQKRSRLIDQLLASPRYGQYLADIWQEYLISPLADDRRVRADRFRPWLAAEFNTNTWDRTATALLTATGKMEDNPAVIYLIEGRLPRTVPDLTDLTSRYLLGIRLNCAQCHDHPTVNWKQQDFWGMAAFFTQIQTPRRAKQVYERGVVDDPSLTLSTLRDASTPDGFVLRPPTFLGGQAAASGTTNRAALATWMTSPDNPYFARAMVNRTWWRLFGRGLVHPVDDMHEANPSTHPELLDLLARQFIATGFDLKSLTRAIVSSRAYQRTSRPGEADTKQAELFGRMAIKVLTAGQLYDSLEAVTGSPAKVTGIDVRRGARPEFIEFFADNGDPNPTDYRRGIPHLLRLMNSGQFAGGNLDSLVEGLAPPGRKPAEVLLDLWVTILARRPAPDELRGLLATVESAAAPPEAYRQLAWALLMSSEFSLNH